MRRETKLCIAAFLASMSAMSAGAREYITTDNKTFSGNYSNNTAEAGAGAYNAANNTKFDGAKFSNNKAESSSSGLGDGGAIRNGATENPAMINIIRDCTFKNNTSVRDGGAITNASSTIKNGIVKSKFEGNKVLDAGDSYQYRQSGGAIYNSRGTISGKGIKDSTFKNNTAPDEGGAISNTGTISQISGSKFTGNTSGSGGAIENDGTITKITGSTFSKNTADISGGAINLSVITYEGDEKEYKGLINLVSNSKFENNTAKLTGGAIYNNYSTSIEEINGSTFANNSAGSTGVNTEGGGAISNVGTLKNLYNSGFTGNSSKYHGGAISNSGTINNIYNNTFTSNHADAIGGAIYNDGTIENLSNTVFTGNYAGLQGGAVDNVDGTINTISNTTFSGNYVNIAADAATDSDIGSGAGALYHGMSGSSSSANTITIKDSTFDENYVEDLRTAGLAIGGAVGATAPLNIENTNFTNNYMKSTSGNVYGSAIATSNDLTVTDSSFTNNKVYAPISDYSAPAAIYVGGANLNINAVNKNVLFAGNEFIETSTSGDASNTYKFDLVLTNSTANLNAAPNTKISFDGIVYGSNATININNDSGNTGEVTCNNLISTNILNLYKGTLSVGKPDTAASNNSALDVYTLHSAGGTINLSNDYIENVQLSVLNIEDDTDVIIDADLGTNAAADTFNVSNSLIASSGSINIKEVNVMSESTSAAGDTKTVSLITGLTSPQDVTNWQTPTVFTSDNYYTTQYDSGSEGVNLVFTNGGSGGLKNLQSYAPSSQENVSYTMTKDETISTDLGAFNSNLKNIYVNGNNHTLSGSQTKGIELSSGQNIEIKDIATVSGFKSENGGFLYNNGGNSELQRIAFENNAATGNGGAVATTGGTLVVTDSSFKNNTADSKGGAIYAGNGANVEINASTVDVEFANNTMANGAVNSIYMDNSEGSAGGTLSLNALGDRKISLSGVNGTSSGYTIKINENLKNGGTVEFTDKVTNATADGGIHLYGGTLRVTQDNFLSGNDLSLHGCTLDMANNSVGVMSLNNLALENTTNLQVDADLRNKKMDTIKATNVTGDGYLNVDLINVIKDAKPAKTTVVFTGKSLGNQNLSSHITNSVTKVKGPVYVYNVSGQQSGNDYKFTFSKTNGKGEYEYNPAVFVGPVAAQLGGYANLLNQYQTAFGSMDSLTSMTSRQMKAYKEANKYAAAGANTELTYSPTDMPVGNQTGIWLKPFTSYETVKMAHGPHKVKNFMYDVLVGADTGLQDMGKGWSAIGNAFAGYLGSHQRFDGNSMYQNGGTFGMSGMLFKNNFFGGITANIGGSGVEASYDAGKESFGMFHTGVATKFGYNWGLANDKFIIQPNLLASYSFVNTSNHTNGYDAKVKSKGLNALQLAPGLKLIGNLKNSWQPYMGANFAWNLIDKARYKINDVSIPQAYIKPYIEYYVGVQKAAGKRFTGYAQFMGRNIGRNGFGVGLGGRWELGD